MALPITVPFTFGNATTTQSLSSLDADFSTVYNAVNGIGNGTVSLANVTITGGSISANITATSISSGTSNVSITSTNGPVSINTNGNNAVYIDASQNVLVGRASVGVGDRFVVQCIASGTIMLGYNSSATNTYQILENGNVRNANNSYGAISDVALKENIVDATPKLDDLMKVQVRHFNLKSDEAKEKQIGVIAQELEAIFPSMIEDGVDGIKGVKYSVFVPMLIKALQEAVTKIVSLETRIAALESK